MGIGFKFLFVVFALFLEISMVAAAVNSLHSARMGTNTAQLKTNGKFFALSVVLGIFVKFIYWLLIAGTNGIITAMFYADGISFIIICLLAVIYMFPLQKINRQYRKADITLCISWIIRSLIAAIIIFLEAYLIAAPIVL